MPPKYQSHVCNSGAIGLNPGIQKGHLHPERAVVETPLNGVNAGGKYTVVEVLPHIFNPIHPTGCQDGDDHHTYTTVSNTYLDPASYGASLGLGTTRGTEQGTDNQEVGNCLGIGKKEAAWTLGGSPCFMGIKLEDDGTYIVTGYMVNDDMGRCRVHLGIADTDQLAFVTFEVRIVMNEEKDAVKETRLIKPVGSNAHETIGKKMLYCTGLPFCAEGTHFAELSDDYDDAFTTNRKNFQATIVNTFKWWLDWRAEKIETIARRQPMIANNPEAMQDLTKSMDVVSMSFAHGIKSGKLVKCEARSTLDTEFDRMIQGHRWTVNGSNWSLATLIASEINYAYYDKMEKNVWVYLDDRDVRVINVYLPLDRIQSGISAQTPHLLQCVEDVRGPCYSRFNHLSGADGHISYGKASFCPSLLATREDRSERVKKGDQYDGIPMVEWPDEGDDDAVPVVAWPGWSMARTRLPPPGMIFTRDGTVVNPRDPMDLFYNPNLFVGINGHAHKSSTAFASIFDCKDEIRSRKGWIEAEKVIPKLCQAMGCRVTLQSDDSLLGLAELEDKLANNLSLMNHESCPVPKMTCQIAEALTSTNGGKDTRQGHRGYFTDNNIVPKNVLDHLFGFTASGVFELKADAFGVNTDKTALCGAVGKISGLHAQAIRHHMMYSMNCTLKDLHLVRIQKLRTHPGPANEMWPHPEARTRRAAAKESAYVPRHNHFDDDTPMAEWIDKCFDYAQLRPAVGINKIIHKDTDQRGWQCYWETREKGNQNDSYFWNPKFKDMIKKRTIRSKPDVTNFVAWIDAGQPMDPRLLTEGMDSVLSKCLSSRLAVTLQQNKVQMWAEQQAAEQAQPDGDAQRFAEGMQADVGEEAGVHEIDAEPGSEPSSAKRRATSSGSARQASVAAAMRSPPGMQPNLVDFGSCTNETHNERFMRSWRDLYPYEDPPFILKGGNGRGDGNMISAAVGTCQEIRRMELNPAATTAETYTGDEVLKIMTTCLSIGMRSTKVVEGKRIVQRTCGKAKLPYPAPPAPTEEAGPSTSSDDDMYPQATEGPNVVDVDDTPASDRSAGKKRARPEADENHPNIQHVVEIDD